MRIRTSLLGLAVGDALGSMLDRTAPAFTIAPGPWKWTDDTAMALSVVELLERDGTLDPDALADAFLARFIAEPDRGYGAGTYGLLARIQYGAVWREAVTQMFGGKGTFGNGAAMRAAPIGACFAPDLDRVRAEASRSAEPTHAHPDGAAGAVAVAIAIAAALATRHALTIAEVARWTPPSLTRDGLLRADALGLACDVERAGTELGTGSHVTSQDTVPFALWCAARHLDSYEAAVLAATTHRGRVDPNAIFTVDRDTLGAIVGGIVACATGIDGIPAAWREACEPLPL
jgi:ADP-ribosylglycohydrolase